MSINPRSLEKMHFLKSHQSLVTAFKLMEKGHVFGIDFPKQFNNWDACEPVDLFDASTLKQEANPKTHIVKHLGNEAKDVDYLILWLDCDREGENICFEVMQCCQIKMRQGSSLKKRILRAKFSCIYCPLILLHKISHHRGRYKVSNV